MEMNDRRRATGKLPEPSVRVEAKPNHLARKSELLWRIMQGKGTSHVDEGEYLSAADSGPSGMYDPTDIHKTGPMFRATQRAIPPGKVCRSCSRYLVYGRFGKDRSKADGRDSKCLSCRTRLRTGKDPLFRIFRHRSMLPTKADGVCMLATCTKQVRPGDCICEEHADLYRQDRATLRVARRAARKSFARLVYEGAV